MAKLQNRAKDRANDVRPYIERAFKDERVREDVKSAVLTAREIYEQLMGGRQLTAAAARVATDKDIQQALRDAIEDLRDAADRIQGKNSHSGRNTTQVCTRKRRTKAGKSCNRPGLLEVTGKSRCSPDRTASK